MKEDLVAVYVAAREVPRRFMGTRVEPKFEAELRQLVGDRYVTRAHVTRSAKDQAIDAARSLAARRGWQIIEKRLSWNTRDATTERAIAEDALDLKEERLARPKRERPEQPEAQERQVLRMIEDLRTRVAGLKSALRDLPRHASAPPDPDRMEEFQAIESSISRLEEQLRCADET